MPIRVMIRGGGDLASGVSYRLFRCGFQVIITEMAQPLMVRRLVSFGEAVYTDKITVEGVTAKLVIDESSLESYLTDGIIPVIVDPEAKSQLGLAPDVIVDGTMRKIRVNVNLNEKPLMIGLGPGFVAGKNCHAAIETKRGHYLGRVFWEGGTEENTGIPETVFQQQEDRVIRAPFEGIIQNRVEIGTFLKKGEVIGWINGIAFSAPFEGQLRGLLHSGLYVSQGMKIGDLDPRGVQDYCYRISDKALAIGGGVLEAILTRHEMRRIL